MDNNPNRDKERKRQHRWEQKNRWMPHYEAKYGVTPIEFSALPGADGTPVVLKAKCRFCETFGREVLLVSSNESCNPANNTCASGATTDTFSGASLLHGDGSGNTGTASAGSETDPSVRPLKRRKKRQTLKVFGPNFRTDNLESHLSREHPVKWKEYDHLRDHEKKLFFPDALNNANNNGATPNAIVAQSSTSLGSGATNSNNILQVSPSSLNPTKMLPYSAIFLEKPNLSIKYIVPTELMEMVDQLLSNRSVKSTTSGSENNTSGNSSSSTWWSQFVRLDDFMDESLLPAPIDTNVNVEMASLTSTSSTNTNVVSLEIKNETLFHYIVDAFSAGLSFEATLAMVTATHRLVPEPAMLRGDGRSTNLSRVIGSVRDVVAANLSSIALLISYSWGYSLLLRFVTCHSTGYVDVRLQIAVNDEIHDVHLLAVPLDSQRHTVEALGGLLVKVLSALDTRAMKKIIGVTIEGDPYHMAKYKQIGAWLQKETSEATNNAVFYVLYSGAYHINMIVEELLEAYQEEFNFLTTVIELEALCKTHQSLMEILGPEPSRVASAHWIEVYNFCEWIAMHRESLVKWCHDHDERHRLPSNAWWIVVFLLREILKDVYIVYKKCIHNASSFGDIQRHIRELVFQLRLKFNIKSSMPTTAAAGVGSTGSDLKQTYSPLPSSSFAHDSISNSSVAQQFLDHPSEFTYQDFVNAVIPLDLYMYEAFQLKSIDEVGEAEREHVYQRFNVLIMLLINKLLTIASVSAESSSVGSSAASESTPGFPDFHQYNVDIPPSTPYELITINNLSFMELLDSQQYRIRAKWTGKVLAMITEDRNRMVSEFSQRGQFYEAVTFAAKQQHQCTYSFRDAWKVASLEFPSLCNFAIVFGSLLSVAKYDVHPQHEATKTRVSNAQLEAHLHGQQFHRINLLRKHVDTIV